MAHLVCVFIIPVGALLFFNGSIIARMKRTSKTLSEMGNSHQKQRSNTTKILLWIVITFFVFHIPRLTYMYTDNDILGPEDISAWYWLLVARLALISNSSENFIIYSWIGREFRKEFLNLFRYTKIWLKMTANKTDSTNTKSVIIVVDLAPATVLSPSNVPPK